MASEQSRWTNWRQRQKLDKAIQLGLKLFQPDVDLEINNMQNVHAAAVVSSDSSDVNDDEQDLLADYVEDFYHNQTHTHIRDSINATDIASALVLLKKQHRLSTKCIDDIIRLLKILHVPNTPSSWYKIKRLLIKTKPQSTEYFICPTCDQLTTDKGYCQFCLTTHHIKLQSFRSFSITNQLQNILINNQHIDLRYQNKDSLLRDIRDAAVFQSIRDKNADPMLTLIMNFDGVQPSKGAQSTIWPIILVVNELPSNVRFALENIILAGVWPGPSKPSRAAIKHVFRPVIDELLLLEAGRAFRLSDKRIQIVHVYLIAACCDKPAQALVQCLPDPHTAFGCGRCEIEGFMIRTKKGGNVRSFSTSQNDIDNIPQQLRDLWPKKKQLMVQLADENNEKGIMGVCLFRELAHFDVGRSFMADSLHNIYIGAFKRILGLWLDPEHQHEEWSVAGRIVELSDLFHQVRLPSTTTRLPRSLINYKKFKANELRVLLLFGHVIFQKVLRKRYYDHLLQLVVIMYLAEGREIDKLDIDIITRLSNTFVICFSKLYSDRHCVQVVHSVIHVAQTVKDFGPLTNYTTFQFENDIGKHILLYFGENVHIYLTGMLVRATKSSINHGQEMIGNLCLLQHALRHSFDPTIKTDFAAYLSAHFLHSDRHPKQQNLKVRHKNKKEDSAVRRLFPHAKLNFYNTLHINHLRLSTRSYSNKKATDDSNILFLLNGNKYFGRIRSIFTVDDGQPVLFVAYLLNVSPLVCPLDGSAKFEYSGIQAASTTNWSFVLINVENFIEKTVLFESPHHQSCFFRFPNLVHSS